MTQHTPEICFSEVDLSFTVIKVKMSTRLYFVLLCIEKEEQISLWELVLIRIFTRQLKGTNWNFTMYSDGHMFKMFWYTCLRSIWRRIYDLCYKYLILSEWSVYIWVYPGKETLKIWYLVATVPLHQKVLVKTVFVMLHANSPREMFWILQVKSKKLIVYRVNWC